MRKLKRILVGILAMVMLVGASMAVNAEGVVAPIKSIKIQQQKIDKSGKVTWPNTSSVTVYRNGNKKDEVTLRVYYTWDNKDKKGNELTEPVEPTVSTSNRGVVKAALGTPVQDKVSGKTVSYAADLTLSLGKNDGKATITVKDLSGKKTGKLTVTVKTAAEGIGFDENLVQNDVITIASSKNSTLNLGAYVKNAASDKKLTYKVTDGGSYIKCDSKGNITVKKNISDSAIGGKIGTVTVTANDKGGSSAAVDVYAAKSTVTSIKIADGKSLKLKTNKGSHTHELTVTGADVEDLSFASNKPAVAKVDENGKITALGNGKATITVSSKLSSKVKKTITVNVTTDVEYMTTAFTSKQILANNKDTAKISAATNPNASKKTVKYEITSVKDSADGDAEVAANKRKNYITVDGKGNVKAKKPCEATIRAYATDNKAVGQTVDVKAVIPVNKITLAGDGLVTNKGKNTATIYITGEDEQPTLNLAAIATAKSNTDIPSNTEVTWTTSKASVASVEDGVVTANGNGTATITAKAKDGSGKSASVKVTVKTDAYDISVAKAQGGFVYVVDTGTAKKSYKLASIIKAATNTNASTKGINYFVVDADGKETKKTSITLFADEGRDSAVVRVRPADKRASVEVYEDITVKRITNREELADAIELTVDVDEVQLIPGGSEVVNADVTVTGNGILPDKTAITWSSKNSKIATVKNGVITAKKAGKTTITAKYSANGYSDSVTLNVYVGRTEADVLKEVNNAFTTALKAENRDYTGIAASFNAKNKNIALKILDSKQDVNELEDTGIVAALESIANKNPLLEYASVEMIDDSGIEYRIERGQDRRTVTVYEGDKVLDSDVSVDAAIKEVFGNTTLKDWNGKNYDITLNLMDTRKFGEDEKTYDYALNYTAAITMDKKLYDGLIDEAIDAELKDLGILGVDGVTYDGSKNEFYVEVADLGQDIREAVKGQTSVAAFADVLEDAATVKLTVYAPVNGATKPYDVFEKTNNGQTDEFIESLLNGYLDKLDKLGYKTFGDLDGSVAVADVTYRVGNVEYVLSYKLDFVLGEAQPIMDRRADKAIEEARPKNAPYGDVVYDAENNVLSVNINDEYSQKSPVDLMGNGIKTALDAMISNTNVSKVSVTVDGETKEYLKSETDIALGLSIQLTDGVTTLSELNGRKAEVKVIYTFNGKAFAVYYTIEFTATVPAADDSTKENTDDSMVSEEPVVDDEPTTDETVLEENEVIDEETDETVEEILDEVPEEPVEEEVG